MLKNGVHPSEEIKNHILEECKKPLTIYGTDEVSQLNDYEIPESIDFVPFIPKTKADKVDYTTLEEFAWQEAVSEKMLSQNNNNGKKLTRKIIDF